MVRGRQVGRHFSPGSPRTVLASVHLIDYSVRPELVGGCSPEVHFGVDEWVKTTGTGSDVTNDVNE